MFDRFGEFDSWEEINKAAEGQKEEGDFNALKALAKENGIDEEDAQDYIDGIVDELCNSSMAAIGKINIEKQDMGLTEIMSDWADYIIKESIEDEKMALAVRKKGKSLAGAIGAVLKQSWKIKAAVPEEVMEAAGIHARVEMGIPGYATVTKILRDYYIGG